MIQRLRAFRGNYLAAGLAASGLILAIAAGWWIGRNGLGYQALLVGLLAFAGLAMVLSGERGLLVGLTLWIWMFALGYRTIYITPLFRLHPLVVYLLALLAVVLLNSRVQSRRAPRRLMRLPIWLRVFMFFWMWGWLVGSLRNLRWDAMLVGLSNFAVFIPTLWVVDFVLDSDEKQSVVLTTFVGVGTLIALLGSTEYFFPGVRRLFPGFIADQTTYIAQGGFLRAVYAYWGNSVATFICALSLPFCWPLWHSASRTVARVMLLLAVAVQLVGIYIGGFRSVWILLVVVLILMVYIRRGLGTAALTAVGSGFVYLLLPAAAQARFVSGVAALQGNFQDSSALDRWNRAVTAFQTILTHPFGLGWAGISFVHSDFLQVAIGLGIAAGAVFVAGYLLTLWRMWRLQTNTQSDPLNLALVGSFVIVGGLFLTQPNQELAQLMVPLWFVWAMVETRLRRSPLPPAAAPE
jgi:hypothetical protein